MRHLGTRGMGGRPPKLGPTPIRTGHLKTVDIRVDISKDITRPTHPIGCLVGYRRLTGTLIATSLRSISTRATSALPLSVQSLLFVRQIGPSEDIKKDKGAASLVLEGAHGEIIRSLCESVSIHQCRKAYGSSQAVVDDVMMIVASRSCGVLTITSTGPKGLLFPPDVIRDMSFSSVL